MPFSKFASSSTVAGGLIDLAVVAREIWDQLYWHTIKKYCV